MTADPSATAAALAASRALSSRLAARTLLDIEAVLVRPDEPFRLTSGRLSPVYVDCRRVIGFPRARRLLTGLAVDALAQAAGAEAFDVIAGGETAGIPYAAWLAEALGLPMAYVRKEPKGFGRMAQIEGVLGEGRRVLLVEDLATDGGSKVRFVEALRRAGARVDHALVVFYYGIFPQAEVTFRTLGLTLHALATWADILAVIRAEERLDPAALATVERFLAAPDRWTP